MPESTASYVYLLVSTHGNTYVGATVDLERRLRQHNRELVGGAMATSRLVKQGECWSRACYVEGFPDWRTALQFEWRWKQLSRQLPRKMQPLDRRMQALDKLLALDKPTSKAMPYAEWPESPRVIHEIDDA